MKDWRIIEGDCREVMAAMEPASIDAIVCDPPYGLEFMGKEWDKLATPKPGNLGGFANGNKPSFERVRSHLPAMQQWHHAWAVEALRVLKPGGHLIAFGGTRTYHRLTCALEDAGFEIRDCLAWMYGSGFPKSLDVSKAIDKAAGADREKVRHAPRPASSGTMSGKMDTRPWIEKARVAGFHEVAGSIPITAAAAAAWQGWGTALKPAFEPIVLARKPLTGSVAANVQLHGTGALNIDGCRVDTGPSPSVAMRERGEAPSSCRPGAYGHTIQNRITPEQWKTPKPGELLGRWPANVVLGCACEGDNHASDCPVALLDAQSGDSMSMAAVPTTGFDDFGGASRFFYCAKVDREEREKGLDGIPLRQAGTYAQDEWSRQNMGNTPDAARRGVANTHPTVKPVALMRWLCRLITPLGGLVLDPFTGSGSTGIAALIEGFRFVGIEQSAEYATIARRRIEGDAPLFNRRTAAEGNP